MKTIKLLTTATAILFASTLMSSAHGITVKSYPFTGPGQYFTVYQQASAYAQNNKGTHVDFVGVAWCWGKWLVNRNP